jgi:hypothetical protein
MRVKTVQFTSITVDSLAPSGTVEIKEGELALTLTAGQTVKITPN